MFGRDGRGPDFGDDEFHLGGRLMYLLMLMRRGEAAARPSGERRPGTAHGQGRVLRLLSRSSPASQKELAYLLGIRSQSLAELVSKLEAAGLVTRQPDPNDRRTSQVDLTEAGRAAADDIVEGLVSDPFAVLGDEDKQHLAALLDRVIEGVEEQLPNGPDPRMRMFKQMALGGDAPEGFGGGFPGGFGPGGFGPRGFGPRGFGPRGFGRGDREDRGVRGDRGDRGGR